MKFVCEKDNIHKAINSVTKAVAVRTTMPILERILIQTNDNEVKFTTYDLELGIEYIINCNVQEQGSTVVNSIMFSEIIRKLPSNPASHGGATVATVLNDPQLRQEWENELTEMRERIKKMRHLFVQLLKEYGAEQDFSFIMEQNGMFSFSGLSPEQVDRLKEEFAIYAVRSGRINVAGITEDNIRYLCESIVKVL